MANVKPLIAATVAKFAETTSYNHYNAQSRVGMMCDRVREELKQFGYARYRYIISGALNLSARNEKFFIIKWTTKFNLESLIIGK